MKAHGSQTRASGDPYFLHPLEVAGILTRYKLDAATIATALLHDTIEDTVATFEDIEEQFGPEVAKLVDGVTKLSKLEFKTDHARQAENFRKLLLAMSDDIRVLLVKLADRLHNMRTLHFISKPEKRLRIARETMDIYAPLAERIGMQEIKDELEDLAFVELNPDARQSIISRLEYLREEGGDLMERISGELRETLEREGVRAEVSGREKRPYSIWRKMERKNVSFEHLSDIIAFRVIVDTVEDCYRALGIIHGSYSMVPGRFKDYISTPKANNYQSLHTTVIGPERSRVEIQIRTREMHEVAEKGVAAHWQYKQGGGNDGGQYRWLRELLEILENADDPEEFLEHTKLNMFQDQVFCFSPKGDLVALPSGATPVDFAYAVHTDVGDTCVAAKINGRVQPLRTILNNGDQVEILRSRNGTPSPSWEGFVVTGKARSAIRRFIRQQKRDQYLELGRQIGERAFRKAGIAFSDKAIQSGLARLGYDSPEDVYVALGEGVLTGRQLVAQLFPEQKNTTGDTAVAKSGGRRKSASADEPIAIRGLIPGMAVHLAGCCHPLPGDRIVGIVTTGKGVTIHTIDCDTLDNFAESPERWLDVSWGQGEEEKNNHIGRLKTVVANEPGALSSLTTIIARNMGNISNLRIVHRSAEFFEMIIDVEVRDVKHLTNIVAALRADQAICSVERARG